MNAEKASWESSPSRVDPFPSSSLVRDLMSQKPYTCSPSFTLEAVAQIMKNHKVGMVPVVDGRAVLGVITDRDLAVRGYANGCSPSTKISSLLEPKELGTVFEDDDIKTAESVFKSKKLRRLLVLERSSGHLVGILSMDDIALGLGHKRSGAVLESIVSGSL